MSHFNEAAKNWDDESKIEMMATLAAHTQRALDLNKRLDILDFGCGTGLFGLQMAEYASHLLGIDTSEKMLDVFNEKTKGDARFSSRCIDLEQESIDQKFDLILSSMAFHHLNRPSEMIAKFKAMLRPQGRIAIVDLDAEDGSFHPDNHGMGVKHFGFARSELEDWAAKSGLRLNHRIIHHVAKNSRRYGQFLAVFTC